MCCSCCYSEEMKVTRMLFCMFYHLLYYQKELQRFRGLARLHRRNSKVYRCMPYLNILILEGSSSGWVFLLWKIQALIKLLIKGLFLDALLFCFGRFDIYSVILFTAIGFGFTFGLCLKVKYVPDQQWNYYWETLEKALKAWQFVLKECCSS